MKNACSLAALLFLCFLLVNCQKKEEAPAPSMEVENSSTNPTKFTIEGDGLSNQDIIVDQAFQQDFNSDGIRHQQADSFQLNVRGSGVFNGLTKNIAINLRSHYSGLGSYSIGNNVGDATLMYIYIYSSTFELEKTYKCQSGTLTVLDINNGYFTATYSGVFMMYNDPSSSVTINNGEFVCPFITSN